MAWSRHCRARMSACGMRRVRASQVYRRARPACPLPSEGSRSPGDAVMDVLDSAMASTACRASSAVVPDKMGRQHFAALASSGFAIRPGPLRSRRKSAAGAKLPSTTWLTSPRRAAVFRQRHRVVVRPERGLGSARALALPDPFHLRLSCRPVLRVRVAGSPPYAFGLAAARRLGVRTAVRSAIRRRVGAALRTTDDPGQFLLVKSPQGLFGQCQLPLTFLHEAPPLWGIEVIQGRLKSNKGVTKTAYDHRIGLVNGH